MSRRTLRHERQSGTALYMVEVLGAALLIAGHVAGLYVAAVAMIVALAFTISGAWLLVVGVAVRQPKRRAAEP